MAAAFSQSGQQNSAEEELRADPTARAAFPQFLIMKGYLMRTKFLLIASVIAFLASASPAQTEKKNGRAGDKVTVILTQEVKDYAAWRKVYDEKTRARRSALVKVTGVYTDAKNPNMVTIIALVKNEALVDSITANPLFKSALDDAGVVGSPDITVLKRMGPE